MVKPPATKVPDDGMEHVIYGRVLTLYPLEQKSKAKKRYAKRRLLAFGGKEAYKEPPLTTKERA